MIHECGMPRKMKCSRPEENRTTPAWLLGCMLIVPIVVLVPSISGLPSSGLDRSRDEAGRKPQAGQQLIDPCLGSHWQMVLNPAHPGWPGRLVLLDPKDRNSIRHNDHTGERASEEMEAAVQSPGLLEENQSVSKLASPVTIRIGDHVTVDQQSEVMQARFQAVALESAGVGQRLLVRLNAGANSQRSGPVIPVLATGAGRAKWLAAE